MKTEEDEAFDELAKRQGAWGGGFKAKRAMAADKYSDIVSDGGLDPRNKMDAQPAQEPVAWITPDGEGFRIRFSPPTSEVPLGWDALYTAPPQRPWVGLTDEDMNVVMEEESCSYIAGAKWAEEILRGKNS